MRVTLKDVARLANVNFTLVSKYINQTPGVRMRPETRQRIESAIHELKYQPITVARRPSLRAYGYVGADRGEI